MKLYALVDCNSFFASCEKVFRPDWKNRPVVVLSNNDGCVVARSPEAKPLIEMGVPYFQIKALARQHGVVVRSANFAFYGDMSRRVMETLRRWSDKVEIYSIDEAFLDLTGRFGRELGEWRTEPDGAIPPRFADRLEEMGREIAQTVPALTGIPVSVGIATTRTLAKAANRLGKNLPDHCCSLADPRKCAEKLKHLPISDIWGVGRQLGAKFRRLGLRTAYDLAQVDPLYMRKNFTVVQERLVRELTGDACFNPADAPESHQSIQVSRSFGDMVWDLPELEKAVATFAAKGAERLRKKQLTASAAVVYISTNRFRNDMPQYHPSTVVGFLHPSSDSAEILKATNVALKSIFRSGYGFKRAGVLFTGLVPEEAARSRNYLFEPEPDTDFPLRTDRESMANRRRLYDAVDKMNRNLGGGKIFFAAEGIQKQWRPSAQFQSPSWTTNWNQIPVVYAK